MALFDAAQAPLRAVVTGSRGFIGAHVVARLRAAGTAVVEVDLRASGGHDIRRRLDPGTWAGADVVVHLAALAGVAPSLRHPEAYYETNVGGSGHVLDAAVAAGVPRVVLASSSSVFGHCDEPAGEDLPLRPLSPYARSKALMEQRSREDADRLQVVVVRPFTVYGPGQRPDMLIGRLLSGERPALWPFERDFTYVEDVADAITAATCAPITASWSAFNLGSGRPVGATALLGELARLTGVRPAVVWGGQRPGEPGRTWADPGRAVATLGFRPGTALADGLRAQAAAMQPAQAAG